MSELQLGEGVSFECNFTAFGRETVHSEVCSFDVVYDEDYTIELYYNKDKTVSNPSEIDLKRYKIKPLIGFLKEKDKTYANAKIVFIKKNQINSTFGDVVQEICYTDEGGKYMAYITKGLYDIEISIGNRKTVKRNVEITEGMRSQYYFLVRGLIQERNKDTIRFCGCDYKNVFGQIIDNKGTPVENAEIIVLKDNDIKAYFKTDDDGRYRFALKNGEYLVKLRSNNSPLKQTKIIVDDRNDFNEQLCANSILFNKNSMLYL